jgi:hypothetical protein
MSEISTPEAIAVITRHFMHGAIEHEAENGWELYPEISENDWVRVQGAAQSLLGELPTREEFECAYQHLEARAQEHPGGE